MKRGLFFALTLILLVVSMILIFNFSGITGFAVSNIQRCSDSDGGDKPFIKGIVKYKPIASTRTFFDECISTTRLRENYCKYDRHESRTYSCKNGCRNDACV